MLLLLVLLLLRLKAFSPEPFTRANHNLMKYWARMKALEGGEGKRRIKKHHRAAQVAIYIQIKYFSRNCSRLKIKIFAFLLLPFLFAIIL